MSSTFPQKIVIGDYGKDDNNFISTYSVSDFSGGMGLWKYENTNDPSQYNYYWDGQNIDTLNGTLTLGPLATSIGSPVSTSNFIHSLGLFDGNLVVSAITSAYAHNGTSWGSGVSLGTTAMQIKNFKGRMFFVRRSGYSYQTTAGGAATNVGDPDAICVEVWDGNIWALDTSFQLWKSDTGDSGDWGAGLASLPISTVGHGVGGEVVGAKLVVFDSEAGEILYALTTAGRAYAYDAVNDKWIEQKLSFPAWRVTQSGFNQYPDIIGTIYGDDMIYRTGNFGVYKINYDGRLVVDDISLGYKFGVPTNYNNWFESFTANNHWTFATFAGNLVTNGEWAVLVFNGKGWHPIRNSESSTQSITASRPIVVGGLSSTIIERLYFVEHDDGNGYHVRWINTDALRQHPLTNTTRTYCTAGNIELPYFAGGYEAQQKTALKIRVKLLGAGTTETVQVAYRLDGSTGAYTNLGSAVNSDTETTIYFGTNSEGLAFKSIQFKLSLVRGATTTSAPKLEYFHLDFIRNPEVLRGFNVTIDCTSEIGGETVSEQVDRLWAIIGTSTLGTFSYRDDAGNTRSYLVKAMVPQGMEETAHDERGVYRLFLVELSNP